MFDGVRFQRGGRLVLDVPELSFASGRVTALLGPNGSGKSTMLRLVAGLERPGTGRVTLDDRLASTDRATRMSIGYAFQDAVFLGGTLRSNLDLALRLRGLNAAARKERIGEAAEACGIAHLLDRDARRLSGGEAQRANLARTLSLRAPVTLLDEPFAGLDAPGRAQMLEELPGLLRRFTATTIVVTHDRDEALRLADDLVVLLGGQVRAHGPKRDVFRAPPDAEVAAFLGYAVFTSDSGIVAVAPGALSAGPGEVCFEMCINTVVDLGSHFEASGRVQGARVSVPLAAQGPVAGETLSVSAPASAVIRFG
ncbi:MAG: ABC transporter ATP-binding protein [Tepidiformaceae bacterium]